MKHLPKLAITLTYYYNAWIVGSAAKRGVDIATLKDIDIIVPFENWQDAAMHIPRNASPNTFGGWKCNEDQVTYDIWPGDLGILFNFSQTKYAWSPKNSIYLVKEE